MPNEHEEQKVVIEWSILMQNKHPELKLLFAVPNGGKRHVVTAMKMKAEGVKAGVPDLFLPVARGAWHGLFIEMKTAKGKVSPHQAEWLEALKEQGYMCEVCYGAEEAINLLESYFKLKTN